MLLTTSAVTLTHLVVTLTTIATIAVAFCHIIYYFLISLLLVFVGIYFIEFENLSKSHLLLNTEFEDLSKSDLDGGIIRLRFSWIYRFYLI